MWELIQFVWGNWAYIVATLGLIVLISVGQYAYKLGGIPALVVAVGGLGAAGGYYLGSRRDSGHMSNPTHAGSKPKKRRRPTVFDIGASIFAQQP